ncbi:LOW QUALITY PROTEIN: vicilin-like seed storage protein At2g18540 [Prosopis cineraria]|uniref:LOW QUALITY PROTEIN: vicilin-like seed storage protein At2g18540 n=1 Tax=Prosopis cineraria TaxID=364024 RepID=UPI00240F068E|nr:LOW QUALITY PROTEIN: vicilin-like seed storage protein At2g18540 [Prosopis cineraria]
MSEKDKDEVPLKRKSRKEREDSDVDSENERKHSDSRRKGRESSGSEGEHDRRHRKSDRRKRKSRSRYSSDEYSDSSSDSDDDESEYSGSDSEYSDSESGSLRSEESVSEEERKRRKRKERRRRKQKEEERERKRRRKEKERLRRKKEKEDKRKKEKRKRKKEERKGEKGAVTNSWGKYGVIRETDMWNKRPEFTAWLAEVKQVNLESLSNWEEKQMFKEFMEDHNTATFPSKKYYNLDAYHRRQMEKEMKRGFKKVAAAERTVFNDEEQRRLELQQAREKHKEEQVLALKRSMQSGMAQAMKEQAQLREEMAYQYKLGNFEAAAAIQRRLDPDAAM